MVKGVIEVTGRIEMQIVGDRLFVTVPSGEKATTYAVPFALARNAAEDAARALSEHMPARVVQFRRRGPSLPHG